VNAFVPFQYITTEKRCQALTKNFCKNPGKKFFYYPRTRQYLVKEDVEKLPKNFLKKRLTTVFGGVILWP